MPLHITDEQARLIRDCVTEMVLGRQRIGQPIPDRVRGLLAYVSSCGHGSGCGPAQSDHDPDDTIGTKEAAAILGCTPHTVARIAGDLDGRKVGRDWNFQRHNVIDYAEAKGHQHA